MSAQTRNRASLKAWKKRVAEAAQRDWPSGAPPVRDTVEFKVTYYYDRDAIDADNIIKPLQDALVGIVYGDDAKITRTTSWKRDINGSYRPKGASGKLLMGFAKGTDFIHIIVERLTDLGDLVQ